MRDLNMMVIGDDEDEMERDESWKIRMKLKKIEDVKMKLRFTFHVGMMIFILSPSSFSGSLLDRLQGKESKSISSEETTS